MYVHINAYFYICIVVLFIYSSLCTTRVLGRRLIYVHYSIAVFVYNMYKYTFLHTYFLFFRNEFLMFEYSSLETREYWGDAGILPQYHRRVYICTYIDVCICRYMFLQKYFVLFMYRTL